MHQFFFFFVFCFVLFGSVYSQLDIHVASCIVSAPDLFGVGCKLPLRDACLRCVVCHELHPPCVNNPRIVKDQFGYSVILNRQLAKQFMERIERTRTHL